MLSSYTTALLTLTTTLWPLIQASPTNHVSDSNSKHAPAFFLAGDSTTAAQSSGGGGWGMGFLSFLKSPAWGTDYGKNGATTVSFVASGLWSQVIDAVKENAGNYNVIVTCQFGHNDQKATANISLEEYQTNLEKMALDVKEAGGTPILVTPLTRRTFTSEHNVTQSLADQRQYTIYSAKNTSSLWIDLNQASTQYVNAIGEEAAQAYNLDEDDKTHLNDWGSVVFGRMVADLVSGHPPEVGSDASWTPNSLAEWFVPNNTLSDDIWNGVPA